MPLSSETNMDPRVSIRPLVPTEPNTESIAEQFQNDTLRPILKMQNELLIEMYRHFLLKRKVKFQGMSLPQRSKWIAESLSKDNRLRGILLGMIIGQFTADELNQFIEMEGELRRRIISLITQRLQSQMKALF